jgi:predicted ATP-dependent endonuclease of OLD family
MLWKLAAQAGTEISAPPQDRPWGDEMPKIRRIKIEGFRSIIELDMHATDLTVIVGDNDSGKSNVLRALNLFFNGQTNPNSPFIFANDYSRYTEPRAKKASEIAVELRLELPESYRQNNGDQILWRKRWRADGLQAHIEMLGIRFQKKKRGSGFIEEIFDLPSRSRVPALLNRIQFEYVPAVRGADFFRSLRGRIFEVIAQASESVVRESSGQFETVIGDAVSGLLESISLELKDNSKLRLPNDLTSIFESLDFLNGEKSISLDSRGDGIKARYIPLILKFIAEKSRESSGLSPTFIWAYEEPENNLEFRRAQALADSFKKLAQDEFSQVILTTHSPVFYNMHLHVDNAGICTAYHLSHTTPAVGTKANSAREANVSLDESMGAMAIIAPHIQAAQDALAEASNQAEDLRKKLEALNPNNRPTLFVEGVTEYLVFKALLERFRPDKAPLIFIAEPPPRAGANYVANMLRSWEYRFKHMPADTRVRAHGIVDADGEGEGSIKRIGDELKTFKTVSLAKLPIPDHLAAAKALGVDLPICFEEMWPEARWAEAKANSWLVDRPKKGLIGEVLATRLAEENCPLGDLIDNSWKVFFDCCVDGNFQAHAKVAWATHMVGLSDNDLELSAAELLKVLDAALLKLAV